MININLIFILYGSAIFMLTIRDSFAEISNTNLLDDNKNVIEINDNLIDDKNEVFECGEGEELLKNVSLTAYYPSSKYETQNEDYYDVRGKKLRTLQDFLEGITKYVTVSMDAKLNIPYGKRICINELNRFYKRNINFQVRDNGSNVNGKGDEQIDICVRSEIHSYEPIVNLENVNVVIL